MDNSAKISKQDQYKIPKFNSRRLLLSHFRETMNNTNILSIHSYCLNVTRFLKSLVLFFFCISLMRCVAITAISLDFAGLYNIKYKFLLSLMWAEKI